MRTTSIPALALLTVLAGTVACEKPPVTGTVVDDDDDTAGDGDGDGDGAGDGDGDGDGDGSDGPDLKGEVALPAFFQDRYAMGTKWYSYSPDTHALTPYADAYVVRDGDSDPVRYAAFRVKSYYDEQTAESGLFTLGVSTWDGAAWSGESEWVTPKNVRLEGQLCVDIFARAEKPCDGDGWHLGMNVLSYLSTVASLVVNNPGLFARSHYGTDAYGRVRLARLEGYEVLEGLPDPTTIALLDDVVPPDWHTTDWQFEAFAPNLPEAGTYLGRRFVDDGFVGRDDVYFIINARFTIAKFMLQPVTDGVVDDGLRITWAKADLDRDSGFYDANEMVTTVTDVAAPAVGEVVYLSFDGENLVPDPRDGALEAARWPHSPPPQLFWDLVVARLDDDTLTISTSAASAVINNTEDYLFWELEVPSFEDQTPPYYE